MEWWFYMPVVFWCLLVFFLGLAVGSFLNVLIARLPYEKSIIWPSSRCFNCYFPIRSTDNIPILGYLRLRGKCRKCGVKFSSRYLWIELATGFAFLGLFVVEVLLNVHQIPAIDNGFFAGRAATPPFPGVAMFVFHAFLLSCLIAAAAIDAEHRIIPPMIPYTGVAIGVIFATLMPWPWPNPDAAGFLPPPPGFGPNAPWSLREFWGKIPLGVQPWPFWGPTFPFAPPGSWQIGLLNSLIGALAGSLVVRLIKALFEVGFGREALGLGDADLLMLAGAFLGWQIAVLSLFVGAMMALLLKVLAMLLIRAPEQPTDSAVTGPAVDPRELPFGPGLALGVVVTWLCWRWIGPSVQAVFFDWVTLVLFVIVLVVGVLASGLLLRRPEETATPAKV